MAQLCIQCTCPYTLMGLMHCWQVAHAASKVWAHGMRAQALLRTASVEDRASLELELQAALVPFITKACSNEPQVSSAVCADPTAHALLTRTGQVPRLLLDLHCASASNVSKCSGCLVDGAEIVTCLFLQTRTRSVHAFVLVACSLDSVLEVGHSYNSVPGAW